jgi:hypothetical protein
VVVTTPVETFRALTVAPETTAPLGSVIVPETIASVLWASDDTALSNRQTTRTAATVNLDIEFPLSFELGIKTNPLFLR